MPEKRAQPSLDWRTFGIKELEYYFLEEHKYKENKYFHR